MKRKKRKLNIFFLLHLSVTSVLIIILSAIIAILLRSREHLAGSNRLALVLFFLWITLATIVANLILYHKMKRIFQAVENLSNATEEVAKGNFDLTVYPKEPTHISEIDDLYGSFNQMVRELDGIETLRNDFVANVSHEMKTPTAAIDGYATLLQDETLTPEERRQLLESIIYNCRRLTALTGDILMLSRLDNGTMIPKKAPFRLDEQIRKVVLSVEEVWVEKELELDLEMDPVVYNGDEEMLYHVWMNLIENAVKFSNQKGKLQIRMEENPSDTKVICVTIRDTGIGMSTEQQAHMYDKFYQGDKSHSKEGNGLGLALVRQITELLDISISVKSKRGEGTTFILELPMSD